MMMESRITKRPDKPDQSMLLMADRETFIRVASRGSTIGKLKMAIKEKLWLAREAMAATMVSTDDNPRLPSSRVSKNRGTFTTWLPMSSRKNPNASAERMAIRKRL